MIRKVWSRKVRLAVFGLLFILGLSICAYADDAVTPLLNKRAIDTVWVLMAACPIFRNETALSMPRVKVRPACGITSPIVSGVLYQDIPAVPITALRFIIQSTRSSISAGAMATGTCM